MEQFIRIKAVGRGGYMCTRRMWLRSFLGLWAFAGIVLPLPADARDVARDLRRMKGYCIADAAVVSEVFTSRGGEKYLKLDNGVTFKVDLLLLDPLPLTNVIVFAKPWPKELIDRFKGKIPEGYLYSFKLLIDNQVFDAQPAIP